MGVKSEAPNHLINIDFASCDNSLSTVKQHTYLQVILAVVMAILITIILLSITRNNKDNIELVSRQQRNFIQYAEISERPSGRSIRNRSRILQEQGRAD